MSFVCCGYSITVCLVMSFSLIALHCIVLTLMPLWPCACIACPFLWIAYCTSMYSCIIIFASHLGTLDVRRVELKGKVGAEPEDGVLVDQSRRWKD